MNKISEFIVKARWFIVVFFIAVTIAFGSQLPKAEIEADVKEQLPKDMRSRLTLDKIEEMFGGTDMAMVVISSEDIINKSTLKRVKEISKKMKRIKGVDKVLSLFELKDIRGEDGSMIVDPAVKRIPRNEKMRKELKERLKENDMVYGSVVSEDFSATAVIAQLKSNVNDQFISTEIKKVVESTPGDESVIYGGMPFVRVSVASDMKNDMRQFLPYGLLIMLLFLFICFRQLRGVLLPFAVVIMSIIVGMSLVPIFGWKIHMITILLPVILIAVANDYGIHLMSKYQEDNVEGNDFSKDDIAKRSFKSLGKPVVATGITTMAGMLCLMTHIIVPAKQLGILAAIAIGFALFASLFFIPAMFAILPKAKPVIRKDKNKAFLIERILSAIAKFVAGNPVKILVASLIITLIIGTGIRFVVVDTNPEGYYKDDHLVVKAADMVNSKFGGMNVVNVVAEGDIKDPKVMKKIEKLEKDISEISKVGMTVSLSKVVKQMSRALNDKNESGYDKIPDSRNAIAQYFELYSMSGDPEDFEKLVDFPYKHSLITARIKSASSVVLKEAVEEIQALADRDPVFTEVGGFSAIFSELVDGVVEGQVSSLLLSLAIVALLVMILFRSVVAGLLGAIPLSLSVVLLFGLMGYGGIELNIPTAMLSSIMVGVGIDYTIHFLWRYREERERGHDYVEAVYETLTTTGRGIVFNALSVVIGFVVLMLSTFLPVNFFGFLVTVSIFTCLVGALVLLPALCIIIKPKFLEPKNDKKATA